ncbi:Endonuclease/exonuclease/phosphatase [Powellomyces hirtus]|nr:Endonuclease/exonuclease/phosphatase [Powellomyces hirtus]
MDTYLAPRYTCVKTKTLVGLHLAVYVKKEYVGMVTDIQTADTAVYLNGAKGCVAISLRLLLPPTTPTTTAPARSPTFCFLNAHLKAHEGAADRRNADWAKINHTLPLSPTPTTATPRTTPAGVVDRFDYTFWCGDLNYRTDMGPNRSPWARSLLEKPNPDIGVFIMNDELRKAYVAGTIFRHFSEAPIAFRPTFKFNVAKTQEPHPNPTPNLPHPPPPAHPAASSHLPGYDTSPKQRMPSYTDRILFKTRHPVNIGTTTPRGGESDSDSDPHHHPAPPRIPGLGAALNTSIHVDAYADVPGITHSDHKPVWGRYTVSDVEVPVCAEREGDDDDGGDPVAASSREKTCGAGAGWACGGVLNFWRRRQSRNAVQPVSE